MLRTCVLLALVLCLVQTAADAPRPRVTVKKEWDTTPTWQFRASDDGQSTGSGGEENMWNTWCSWLAGFTFWGATPPGDTNNAGGQSTGFGAWANMWTWGRPRAAGVGIWGAWGAGDRKNAAGAVLRSGLMVVAYVGCEVGYMYMYDTLTVFWMDLIGYTQHMPQQNQTDSGDAAALAESQAALALAESRAALAESQAALAESQAALAESQAARTLSGTQAALVESQAALAAAKAQQRADLNTHREAIEQAVQQGGTEKEKGFVATEDTCQALTTKGSPQPQPVPTPTAQDAEYGRNNDAMYLYNWTKTDEKKNTVGSCKWTCAGQTPLLQPVRAELVSGVQTHQKPLTRVATSEAPPKDAETDNNDRASADKNAPAQDDGWLQKLAIGVALFGAGLLVSAVIARNTPGVTINQIQHNNSPNTNEVVLSETTRQPVTPVGEDVPVFTVEDMANASRRSNIARYEREVWANRLKTRPVAA